ncbi:hypothetical protein BDM02DRAFT_1353045 [Thelephora ganbajun]|uniref:Uncharacterized protein n=1 Tax=Thelephora ganbajun TaxID=370292 RepID=A0ACB6ZML8_THEGA|nr:hypothetical protein BDM02DRAFT_1353045 [Thelephora ganbajun]
MRNDRARERCLCASGRERQVRVLLFRQHIHLLVALVSFVSFHQPTAPCSIPRLNVNLVCSAAEALSADTLATDRAWTVGCQVNEHGLIRPYS